MTNFSPGDEGKSTGVTTVILILLQIVIALLAVIVFQQQTALENEYEGFQSSVNLYLNESAEFLVGPGEQNNKEKLAHFDALDKLTREKRSSKRGRGKKKNRKRKSRKNKKDKLKEGDQDFNGTLSQYNETDSTDGNFEMNYVSMVVDKYHPAIDSHTHLSRPMEKETPMTFWKIQNPDQTIVTFNEGEIRIKQSGVYLIYTHLTYIGNSEFWSHAVVNKKNQQTIIKCYHSEHGLEINEDTGRYYHHIQQCFSSAVVFLKRGHRLFVKNMYRGQVLHSDEELTYWGIAKFN